MLHYAAAESPMIAIHPRILLSVVIPCYNEEEALPRLLEQLTPCLEEATNRAWELILVDDGSFDHNAEIIRDTHQVESRVHGVRFPPAGRGRG